MKKDIQVIITIFSIAGLSTAILYNVVYYYLLDVDLLLYITFSDYIPSILAIICLFIFLQIVSFVVYQSDIEEYDKDAKLMSIFTHSLNKLVDISKVFIHALFFINSIAVLYI